MISLLRATAPRLAPLASAAAFLLSGCSGPAEDPPTEARVSPPPTETGAAPTATPPPPGPLDLRLEKVAGRLDSPLLVTHAGDDSGRLFVVEQGGRIRVLRDGRVAGDPFLDISERVESGGEQGLLGLAFHPSYEANGRFFVNYTDVSGDTVIAEYRVSAADPDRADAGSERVLLHIDQPFANHNGGGTEFGPDGYLYIGMGDGGSGGDPFGNGQRLDTLLGKLLRIDVDSGRRGRGYAIPRDNPFVAKDGARAEIWAYGLRNPWRFSFDPETGELWVGDVGQGALEEINRVDGAEAGLNYGWNIMEGDKCFGGGGCDRSGLVSPLTVYSRDDGCAVIGGHVYRGEGSPAMTGRYFFGDLCSGKVFAVDAGGRARQKPRELLNTERRISSFGRDEDGELYLTDLMTGEIFRLVAA